MAGFNNKIVDIDPVVSIHLKRSRVRRLIESADLQRAGLAHLLAAGAVQDAAEGITRNDIAELEWVSELMRRALVVSHEEPLNITLLRRIASGDVPACFTLKREAAIGLVGSLLMALDLLREHDAEAADTVTRVATQDWL